MRRKFLSSGAGTLRFSKIFQAFGVKPAASESRQVRRRREFQLEFAAVTTERDDPRKARRNIARNRARFERGTPCF